MLDGTFAGAAKAILGPSDPSWVEESTWFPEAMTWRWKIVPDIAANLLSAEGTMVLGAGTGGTTRVVSGDVRVHVPLFGGKVERAIVDGVTRVYAEEADHLTQWLGNAREPRDPESGGA